jgi:hypothetical protein
MHQLEGRKYEKNMQKPFLSWLQKEFPHYFRTISSRQKNFGNLHHAKVMQKLCNKCIERTRLTPQVR